MPVDPARAVRRIFERGTMMLEALVGLAVGALLGLAMAWGAAQVLHSQRYSATQSMAVFAMRQALSTAPAPTGGATATNVTVPFGAGSVTLTAVKNCDAKVWVTMMANGASAAVQYQKPCTLSTDSNATNKSIVGGDGVIQF